MPRITTILAVLLLGGCSLLEPTAPEEPAPAPVEGVAWTLVAGALAVPEDSDITARFEDGRVSGSAGCNHYFAAFTSEGPGRVAIGPAGTTRRSCQPAERMDLEAAFLSALSEVRAYRNTETSLELLGGDGETVLLRFER